jgi:8-oxo-dGTP pyrophosphatase MutT (NUDIX family)
MAVIKPRDAASLIIYRRQAGTLEVLMGRRRRQAKFAPGVYVFPGGNCESTDNNLHRKGHFQFSGLAGKLNQQLRGLAFTAIREAWEETGLLLGEKGRLAKTDHPVWERCRSLGMRPAPQHLQYLGRAITPTNSARRFHARFFVAGFETFTGSLIDEGELLDLRWVSLAKPVKLPMFDVTEFMLSELQRFFQGKRSATPCLSYRKNHTLIRYEQHG